MNSPSDKWAPRSSDDERREAMARYRRDYFAPTNEPRQPSVREAIGVVALCVMVGAFVAALIWLWRA